MAFSKSLMARTVMSGFVSQESNKVINKNAELPKKGVSALNFWFAVCKEKASGGESN